MRTRYGRYRGTWYRRGPLGLYPRGAITLPWGRYERSGYLFWRIRIPLWLVGAASGWALAGPGGVVAGLVAAYVLEGVFSFRPAGIPGSAARPQPASPTDAEVAAAHAHARRWVRIWYTTPLVDRYAYVWMWKHVAGTSCRLARSPTSARPEELSRKLAGSAPRLSGERAE